MVEKVCKNIVNICLIIEAILITVGLLVNYDIKIPLSCFFGIFAINKINEMVDYNDG